MAITGRQSRVAWSCSIASSPGVIAFSAPFIARSSRTSRMPRLAIGVPMPVSGMRSAKCVSRFPWL